MRRSRGIALFITTTVIVLGAMRLRWPWAGAVQSSRWMMQEDTAAALAAEPQLALRRAIQAAASGQVDTVAPPPPLVAPPLLSDGGRALGIGRRSDDVPEASEGLRSVLGDSAPLLALHTRAQRLRLYIYEPPPKHAGWCAANLTVRFPKCTSFQWSGDHELIERVRASEQRVTDGDTADFYLVPFLSKCYFNFAAKYELPPMDAALQQVLAYLGARPWWARRPERHLFFFMSGVGAGIVPSWQQHLRSAVFIVAEGDRQAKYFREGHDIVVPGKVSAKHKRSQLPPADRKLLGVFRGSLDASLRDARGERVRHKNRLRHQLFDALSEEGKKVIFSGRKSKKYVAEMDDAKFCIIPRGNTPWTRRFFDAVVRGCIPAVLSDPVSFPFERLLDYSRMTLKLPEQWAERLARELRSVNNTALAALHARLQTAWPAFIYNGGLAFEMLLLELAARRHAFYEHWTPATSNSEHDFWAPGHGHFRLPGSKKVGPSWGAGAVPHR